MKKLNKNKSLSKSKISLAFSATKGLGSSVCCSNAQMIMSEHQPDLQLPDEFTYLLDVGLGICKIRWNQERDN